MARKKKDKVKKFRKMEEDHEEIKEFRTKKEKPTEKIKTLENVYGSNKLSDTLNYSKTIFVKNEDEIKNYFAKNPDYKNTKSFPLNIKKLSKSNIFTNSDTSTIEDAAIQIIQNAQKTICISSFLIQNNTKLCDSLFAASKRGVDIFLLLASEVMMDRLSEDNEGNEHAKEHVQFLKRAGSGFMFIRTGGFHAKFIVVDPRNSNAQGLVLTSNLTERALTKNKEVAVLLDRNQTIELFDLFKYGFWVEAQHEYRHGQNSNVASLQSITPIQRTLNPGKSIVFTTNTSHQTIKEEIVRFLKGYNTQEELLISSWNFSLDNDISREILKYIGPNTRILLPKRPKNFNAFTEFLEKGAKIRCNYLQHAKFLVTSNKAIIFSSNFEAQGLDSGFEAGIVLKNSEDVNALRTIFDNWFLTAEHVAHRRGKKREYAKRSIELLKRDDKERAGFRLSEMMIYQEMLGTPVKETWGLEDYLKTREDDEMMNLLLGMNKIPTKSNAVNTKYSIEIKPESVPANVSYLKSVDGFHLWVSKFGKNQGRFLVLNKNPLKNEKLFSQAFKIAREENAKVVLY